MPDLKNVFARGLRVCMAEADMKPPQLAEKSTVSVDAIRKYLRGEMAPTLETTCKLALRMFAGGKTERRTCKSVTSAKRLLSRWTDGLYKEVKNHAENQR